MCELQVKIAGFIDMRCHLAPDPSQNRHGTECMAVLSPMAVPGPQPIERNIFPPLAPSMLD